MQPNTTTENTCTHTHTPKQMYTHTDRYRHTQGHTGAQCTLKKPKYSTSVIVRLNALKLSLGGLGGRVVTYWLSCRTAAGLGFESRWGKRNLFVYIYRRYLINATLLYIEFLCVLLITISSVQFCGTYYMAAGLCPLALLYIQIHWLYMALLIECCSSWFHINCKTFFSPSVFLAWDEMSCSVQA